MNNAPARDALDDKVEPPVRRQGRPQGSGPQGQGRRQRAGLRPRIPAREILRLVRRDGDPDGLAGRQRDPGQQLHPRRRVDEGPEPGQGERPLDVHRQGEGPARRLRLLGGGEQFRQQVRPHPDRLRPRLRTPADRRHLGPGRDALRVRRGRQGQEPVLDRQADADPDRRLRPGGVPAPAGRVHDGRVDRPRRSQHGLRAGGDDAAAEAPVPDPPHPPVRAELQPRRTGAPGHRQELRRPGSLPLRRPHDRSDDGREPVRPHGRAHEGTGPDLGRRRLRRGRGPGEDAEGSHHDDEDLLRIRAVPARAGGRDRRSEHGHVRQHEPAGRRHGSDRAPVRADAGR